MHHSFAWCSFFYLSFLFPPVEPGVFNCCVTTLNAAAENICGGVVVLFYFAFSSSLAGIIAPSPALKRIVTVSFLLRITAVVDLEAAIE